MKILILDVGGNNVKVACTGQRQPIKIKSGPEMTPAKMVAAVRASTREWRYDVVSIGYPGPVLRGQIAAEPHNLGRGWIRFNFGKAFGRPVKIINDAAMQALGSYEGKRMLFLGLGTGLGSAMIIDGVLAPMELAHLPYRKGRTYEEYLGRAGLDRLGKKKWRHHVGEVVALFKAATLADYVVLGGGNAKLIKELPYGCFLGANANSFEGGYRLWSNEGRRRSDQKPQT